MSEPPPPITSTVPPPILTSPYPTPYHRQLQPQTQTHHHHIPSTPNLQEYRKGNWTFEEILILITAKRLDEERRINNAATGEFRWKWVENYCWNNGCLRSQNQCNDKWDNLLRDYKKVREHEVSFSSSSSSSNNPSYWEMDKNQRKDRNLPSNLILRIYEALNEVVQRNYLPTLSIQSPSMTMSAPRPPLPPPPPPAAAIAMGHSASDSSETNGSRELEEDQSPKLDPETKRRRRAGDIKSSIVRSTSIFDPNPNELRGEERETTEGGNGNGKSKITR